MTAKAFKFEPEFVHALKEMFEQRIVFGRGSERKAAPPAVVEQEVDVLPGEILQALVRRQLERHDRNIGRDLVDLLDPAPHVHPNRY